MNFKATKRICAILILLVIANFGQPQNLLAQKNQTTKNKTQKALNKDYDKLWDKLAADWRDDLGQQKWGKLDSILNRINQKAKTDQDSIQALRVFVARNSISFTRENYKKTFEAIQSRIRVSKPVERAVLQMFLAMLYKKRSDAMLENQGTLMALQAGAPQNTDSWPAQEFDRQAQLLAFEAVYAHLPLLYRQPANHYLGLDAANSFFDIVYLNQNKKPKKTSAVAKNNQRAAFFPTLADLMLEQAAPILLDMQDNSLSPTNAKSNLLPDSLVVVALLNPTNLARFANLAPDSLTIKQKYLLLLSRLELAHNNAKNQSGLLKIALARISLAEFITAYNNLEYQKRKPIYPKTNENNESINQNIISFLEYTLPNYSENIAGYSEVEFVLAGLYREKMQYQQAIKLCKNIILRKDYMQVFAQAMINELTNRWAQISVSQNILPNQPIYVVLQSKNIAKLYVHIWSLGKDIGQQEAIKIKTDKILLGQKPLSSQSYERVLDKQTGASGSIGVLLEAVPIGFYMIMVCENADAKNPGAHHIRLVEAQAIKIMAINIANEAAFRLLNAKTGQAIIPKKAWANVYESLNQGGLIFLKKVPLNSTSEGLLTAPPNSFAKPSNYLNRIWKISFLVDTDTLSAEQWVNYQPETTFVPNAPRTVLRHFIYTDRALFKPNDTIRLAGIVFSEFKNKRKAIEPGSIINIALADANGEQVWAGTALLSPKGNYSSKIPIASGRLDGQWSVSAHLQNPIADIEQQQGYTYIRVEAFKKPKLELILSQPLLQKIKVWGQTRLSGTVRSINGIGLQRAKVKISLRGQKFWFFYKSALVGYNYQNNTNQQNAVLFSDETTTDARGNFEFVLDGASMRLAKNLTGVEVQIEAISPDGESQQISTNLGLLAADFDFRPIVGAYYPKDSSKIIAWKAEDQYGNKPKATVFWQIFKQKPSNLIANNGPIEQADTLIGNAADFQTFYPFVLTRKQPIYEPVGQGKNALNTDSVIDKAKLSAILGSSGRYKIVFKAVSLQNPEDTLVSFDIFEVGSLQPSNIAKNDNLFGIIETENKIIVNNQTQKPVKNIEIRVSTAASSVLVWVEARQKNEFVYRKYVQIKQGISLIELPIMEKLAKDGSPIQIVMSGIFENVIFNGSYTMNIIVAQPIIKTIPLTLVPIGVADKMLPASNQKWSFRLMQGKTAVQGQGFATLYDGALDKIMPHNWQVWNASWPEQPEQQIQERYIYQPQWNWICLDNRIYFEHQSNSNYYYSENNWEQFVANQRASRLFQKDYFDYSNESYGGHYPRRMLARGQKNSLKLEENSGNELLTQDNMAMSALVAPNPSPATLSAKVAGVSVAPRAEPTIVFRKNLKDLAFFAPQITTDASGNLSVTFSAPEALSSWRFMMLAYNENFEPAYLELSRPTQKLLMSQPHLPRYFRESDTLRLTSLIKNISDKLINGQARLSLLDAQTMLPILINGTPLSPTDQPFALQKDGQFLAAWTIIVPKTGLKAIVCRISAYNKDFSDGEENVLAVLSDRRLITKALPMQLYKKGKHGYKFDALINSNPANSQSIKYSLEAMPNPIWTVVEAIPYLVQDDSHSATAIANRLYANQIAYSITQKQPEILDVIRGWNQSGSDALVSNLEKNPEFKQALLTQTPWLSQAKTETQNKKQIASLLDTKQLESQLDYNLAQLKSLQSADGGFVWWPNMPSNTYLTASIMTLLGRLKHISYVIAPKPNQLQTNMERAAIVFLDRQIALRYLQNIANKNIKNRAFADTDMGMLELMYARSLYLNIGFETLDVYFNGKTTKTDAAKAYNYYLKMINKPRPNQDLDRKALTALILLMQPNKTLYRPLALRIGAQLAERALCQGQQTGCYWPQRGSFNDISTHVLFMEVLAKTQDLRHKDLLNQAKLWLLLQKQSTYWPGTQAVSMACYILLIDAKKQLASPEKLTISLANKPLEISNPAEQASGYYKISFEGEQIRPEMGKIEIQKSTDNFAWAAAYWQYMQDNEKIEASQNSQISIERQYFRLALESGNQVLEPLNAAKPLVVGQTVRVRLVLISRQNLEFVHLKDQRAAAFEPLEQLSGYVYKNGLSYYQTMQDASSEFFISYLPAGTHVFEYDLKASHSGHFSNGMASIECAYSPQMRANSSGSRVLIND